MYWTVHCLPPIASCVPIVLSIAYLAPGISAGLLRAIPWRTTGGEQAVPRYGVSGLIPESDVISVVGELIELANPECLVVYYSQFPWNTA